MGGIYLTFFNEFSYSYNVNSDVVAVRLTFPIPLAAASVVICSGLLRGYFDKSTYFPNKSRRFPKPEATMGAMIPQQEVEKPPFINLAVKPPIN
jgi:hypothetical protein